MLAMKMQGFKTRRMTATDKRTKNMYGHAVDIIASALTVTEDYKEQVIARCDLTFHAEPAFVSRTVPKDTDTEFALVRTNKDHQAVFSWFAVMRRIESGKLDFAD